MVKKIFSITVVIFAAVIAVLDLANFGIPPTHDGEYHVMRFWQFYKVLSEGTLYPRWAPDFNNGFGIPLFNYVYPLPNYVATIFHAVGFGLIDSLKLNMAAATIVGAMFMYLWARKYWGEWGGVVSSVFYTFSPYHFLDIYVRGSVGEVWGLGLAPALIWAYHSYYESNRKIFSVLASIFLALLVFAHNILALIFFSFFISYAVFLIVTRPSATTQPVTRPVTRLTRLNLHSARLRFNLKKTRLRLNLKKKLGRDIEDLTVIIFSGLGLSSPFWLPALLESKYVVGLQVFDPSQHFPALYKLIYSSWGYGFSGTGEQDQMSFQIGIANLIAIVGSLLVFIRTKSQPILFSLLIFLIAVFFITPFSSFIWKSIPVLGYIQFPWRLLSLAILLASFLAGSLVWDSVIKKEKARIIIAVVLILLVVVFSIRYAKAPFYHKRVDQHYLTRANFRDGTNSPGNAFNTKWFAGVPEKRKDKIEVISGLAEIKIKELKSTSYSFIANSKGGSKILVNTAYFPGWTAQINGTGSKIEENKGKITLSVPSGTNNIRVFLDNTPIQELSYVYFLASILILVLFSGANAKYLRKTPSGS